MSRKDIARPFRKAAHQAEQQGWTITHGGSHLKWQPRGQMPIFTPSSPGEGRSVENSIQKLKRAGLRIGRGRD